MFLEIVGLSQSLEEDTNSFYVTCL